MIVSIFPKTEEKSKEEVSDCRIELFRKGYRIRTQEKISIHEKIKLNPDLSSRSILLQEKQVEISVSQLNRLRKEWQLSKRRGRPNRSKNSQQELKTVCCSSKIGLELFSNWLTSEHKNNGIFEAIFEQIENYKQEHPAENFRLLKSRRETIEKKWLALSILALLGIKKLSELDYKQHNMDSVLGYSYGYSSLRQFLAELERIDLGENLNLLLSKENRGKYIYIDGHMIAFWSRKKIHKGHITMLGRIMPGSNAVVAHNEFGEAIWCEYSPADIHLSHIVPSYCSNVAEATGSRNFIIDREVNSVDMAKLFIGAGWQLICLLNANQYQGLESFNKKYCGQLSDGTILYKATWKEWREDDPRLFVIAKQKDRCLVYWGTPKIIQRLTAKEIVLLYRARSGIQENSFRNMISHGALNVNFGNKTIATLDRTQQRKIEKVDSKIEKLEAKQIKTSQEIEQQNTKIIESNEKNHAKRFEQRCNKLELLQQKKACIDTKISSEQQRKSQLGQPSQRHDRDFRKQSIMTFRTLFIENILRSFWLILTCNLAEPIDLKTFIDLFFHRSGFIVENESQVIYWLDPENLSSRYQDILMSLVDGFNSISLASGNKEILVKVLGFS